MEIEPSPELVNQLIESNQALGMALSEIGRAAGLAPGASSCEIQTRVVELVDQVAALVRQWENRSPTQWAYDRTRIALNLQWERATRAEAEVEALRIELASARDRAQLRALEQG